MRDVKLEDFRALCVIADGKGVREDEEGEHPFFVPRRADEHRDLRQGHPVSFFGDAAQLGDADAEKLVAFSILARSGFEKAQGVRCFLGVGESG